MRQAYHGNTLNFVSEAGFFEPFTPVSGSGNRGHYTLEGIIRPTNTQLPIMDLVARNSLAAAERLTAAERRCARDENYLYIPVQDKLDRNMSAQTDNPHFSIQLTNGGGSDHVQFGIWGIPNANHSFRGDLWRTGSTPHGPRHHGDFTTNLGAQLVPLESIYHTIDDRFWYNYCDLRMELAIKVAIASAWNIARVEPQESFTITFDTGPAVQVGGGELLQENVYTFAGNEPILERRGFQLVGWMPSGNVTDGIVMTAQWRAVATSTAVSTAAPHQRAADPGTTFRPAPLTLEQLAARTVNPSTAHSAARVTTMVREQKAAGANEVTLNLAPDVRHVRISAATMNAKIAADAPLNVVRGPVTVTLPVELMQGLVATQARVFSVYVDKVVEDDEATANVRITASGRPVRNLSAPYVITAN